MQKRIVIIGVGSAGYVTAIHAHPMVGEAVAAAAHALTGGALHGLPGVKIP